MLPTSSYARLLSELYLSQSIKQYNLMLYMTCKSKIVWTLQGIRLLDVMSLNALLIRRTFVGKRHGHILSSIVWVGIINIECEMYPLEGIC